MKTKAVIRTTSFRKIILLLLAQIGSAFSQGKHLIKPYGLIKLMS